MKNRFTNTLFKLAACTAAAFCTAGTTAEAASVFINENAALVAGGTTVAGAKLRASNSAWDQALSNGVSFNAANAVRTDVASSFPQPGRNFSFSFENRPGEGFIFRVTEAGQPTSTMAWGTFTNSPGGTVVSTLGGRQPVASFDSLQIEARATLAKSILTFSNIVFTAPDLNIASGSFYDGMLMRTLTIGDNPRGTATQNLFADVDLSQYSWTLSGNVSFIRPSGSGGDENLRLGVVVKNVNQPTPAPVPEPGSAAVLALAAGTFLTRRRRA